MNKPNPKFPKECLVVTVPAFSGPAVIGVAPDITEARDIARKYQERDGGNKNVRNVFPPQYYRVDNGGNVRILVDGKYAKPVAHPSDDVRAAGIEWIRARGVEALNAS